MENPQNCIIVIFGASGDLTCRKLIPAIFELKLQQMLPEKFFIVGVSRSDFTRDVFCEKVVKGIRDFSKEKEIPADQLRDFCDQVTYISMGMDSQDEYVKLGKQVDEIDKKNGIGGNWLFYLATPPDVFEPIAGYLGHAGLTNQEHGYRRIIFEKPFGHDLQSAINLNRDLLKILSEDQIYRID